MENASPFLAMQRVEGEIKALVRSVDMEVLDPAEKKAMTSLRRLAIDARLDIRDYELSETREEQLKCATAAKKHLAKLRIGVLSTGSGFGPADVAQLTAQLEQIEAQIR
ncbi:MAG TPA: hypothetical protein VMB52_06315 [Verrucomicrobiae bacterium]|nr:hypothetical protein [Verrucomicrobiae bacterium]